MLQNSTIQGISGTGSLRIGAAFFVSLHHLQFYMYFIQFLSDLVSSVITYGKQKLIDVSDILCWCYLLILCHHFFSFAITFFIMLLRREELSVSYSFVTFFYVKAFADIYLMRLCKLSNSCN